MYNIHGMCLKERVAWHYVSLSTGLKALLPSSCGRLYTLNILCILTSVVHIVCRTCLSTIRTWVLLPSLLASLSLLMYFIHPLGFLLNTGLSPWQPALKQGVHRGLLLCPWAVYLALGVCQHRLFTGEQPVVSGLQEQERVLAFVVTAHLLGQLVLQ